MKEIYIDDHIVCWKMLSTLQNYPPGMLQFLLQISTLGRLGSLIQGVKVKHPRPLRWRPIISENTNR